MAVYTAQITSDRSPNSGQTERRGEHETPRNADSGRTLGGRTSGRSRTGRDSDRRRAPRTGWVRALTWAGRAAALAAVLFLALNTSPAEPVARTGCAASWCQPGAVEAEAQRILDEQVHALTDGRHCWSPDAGREIPATVVVRGAEVDKTVAWEITLDDAFAVNEDGDSWNDVVVVSACDAG